MVQDWAKPSTVWNPWAPEDWAPQYGKLTSMANQHLQWVNQRFQWAMASSSQTVTLPEGRLFPESSLKIPPSDWVIFPCVIQVRAAVARTSWSWCRPPTSAPVCRCRGPRTTHRCTMAWSATPRAVTARRTPRRPRTSDGEVEMDVEVEGFYCEVVIFW